MSSTQTETTSVNGDHAEFTVVSRITSIPVVYSSLEKMNGTLSTNAYTRTPYSAALGLSNSAYKLAGPHLGPLIVRADSLANMAVDAVQKRYPSAFTATPEDLIGYVQEKQKDVDEYVRRRRDSAGVIAQDIDKRFETIVDYLEIAVNRFDAKENRPSSDRDPSLYQYQRALELSNRLRNQLQFYSTEQINQLQAHSALIKRTTESARSFTTAASSSLVNAQSKLSSMADNIIFELNKLQVQVISLSDSFHASASSTLKDSAGHLPPQIQQKYHELASVLRAQASSASHTYEEFSLNLASTASDLRDIMASENMSMQEKATKMTQEVSVKVHPLLEALSRNVQQTLNGKNEPGSKVNGRS
ncbi:hypothetical protein D9757_001699 [Collybiopsis confluens]|uniref:Lipid droplet-associated perilipin protein n=1 Tax=Collybiopsis confluens TaxID=2823264 RepID=A0A8H5HYF2_9AGAR|nr:hypothetical protein D9757_001699 [Collybiopsis confluens]